MVDPGCIRLALLAQDKFSNCGFTGIRRFRGKKQMANAQLPEKAKLSF
jgi:hypothetical protein